jgi:hypothetical protein
LPSPGGAADEERVVGEAGQLGDRERRGVGEPVAVADDELVEGEPRVVAAHGSRAGGRSAWTPRGAGAAGASTSTVPSVALPPVQGL